MDGLNDAIGAPVTIELDGKSYLADPVTLSDLGTIENFLLSRMPTLPEIAESLSKLAPEVQERLFAKELEQRQNFNRLPPEKVLYWVTQELEGVAYALYLSLSRKYPSEGFTHERCLGLLQKMAERDHKRFLALKQRRNVSSGLEGRDVPLSESGQASGESDQARQEKKAARRKRQRQRKRERLRQRA